MMVEVTEADGTTDELTTVKVDEAIPRSGNLYMETDWTTGGPVLVTLEGGTMDHVRLLEKAGLKVNVLK